MIPDPDNEKYKVPLNPFKVLFNKEKVEDVANEVSLFPCDSIEIPPWNSNVMTHAIRRK